MTFQAATNRKFHFLLLVTLLKVALSFLHQQQKQQQQFRWPQKQQQQQQCLNDATRFSLRTKVPAASPGGVAFRAARRSDGAYAAVPPLLCHRNRIFTTKMASRPNNHQNKKDGWSRHNNARPQNSLASVSSRQRITMQHSRRNEDAEEYFIDDGDDNGKQDEEEEEENWNDELFRVRDEILSERERTKGNKSKQQPPRRKKRHVLRDWIGAGDDSPMVRPISVEDGSIIEESEEERTTTTTTGGGGKKRMKTKFDELFAGMPSVDEMLRDGGGTDDDEEVLQKQREEKSIQNEESSTSVQASSTGGGTNKEEEKEEEYPSWFDEEKSRIEEKFAALVDDIRLQLTEQRQTDPEEVPMNADAMIESLIEQELKKELKTAKRKMEQARLEEYEQQIQPTEERKKSDEETDVREIENEEIQRLIDDDYKSHERYQSVQLDYEAFLKYEQEAIVTAETNMDTIQQPDGNENLDVWALNRMKGMIKGDDEDSLDLNHVDDVLEWNIDELEDNIQQQEAKDNESLVQPESLKEWQMYRSIASQMSSSNEMKARTNEENEIGGRSREEDTIISDKMQSWKDYIEQEESNRKESGLARKYPRLSFEFDSAEDQQEQEELERDRQEQEQKQQENQMSQVDIRKKLNRMSVEALENLSQSSRTTSYRKAELQKELKLLKEELESNDYLDVDESVIERIEQEELSSKLQPVSLSGVFSTSNTTKDKASTISSPLDRTIGYRPAASTTNTDTDDDQTSNDIADFFYKSSKKDEKSGDISGDGTPFLNNDDEDLIAENDDLYDRPLLDTPPPPPNSPFFNDEDDDDFIADNDNLPSNSFPDTPPPPPNSAFFNDDEEDDDIFINDNEETSSSSKIDLGTMEEQKLSAMYRRAGARTAADQQAIQTQWEEFQQIEKIKREQSGLSGDGEETIGQESSNAANLGYEISDVVNADGEIDAEKILASIGPRPTRGKRNENPKVEKNKDSSQEFQKNKNENENENDENTNVRSEQSKEVDNREEDEESVPSSNLNPDEVSDSLYRAVSAVGGGKTKNDPELKENEKQTYLEYMRRQDELRDSLDNLGEEIETSFSADNSTKNTGDDNPLSSSFNDTEYANDVLESLGTRERLMRRRKEQQKEKEAKGDAYDDMGMPRKKVEQQQQVKEDIDDGRVPGWLRTERKSAQQRGNRDDGSSSRGTGFLGMDTDDVIDDDTYERNQRQLAEYEQRRSGDGNGKANMGIDIQDILGERSSDDYADYNYDAKSRGSKVGGGSWGIGTYESRKQNLLEYAELEVLSVNSIMDYKDSVYGDGVSKYQQRINKPFKEFGAIFRLEGVLIDITGLQQRAYEIVAQEYNFKMPRSIADMRRASVVPASVAIRDIFYWTNDMIILRDASLMHRSAVKQVFDEWLAEQEKELPNENEDEDENENSSVINSSNKGNVAIGEDVSLDSNSGVSSGTTSTTKDQKEVNDIFEEKTEEEKMLMLSEAWTKTATQYEFQPPTFEQVMFASMLSPDIAVLEGFQWATDLKQIDEISMCFRRNLHQLSNSNNNIHESGDTGFIDGIDDNANQQQQSLMSEKETKKNKPPMDKDTMMKIHFDVWSTLAKDNQYDPPLPDELIAAFVINDSLFAIRDGFGWTDDPLSLQNLVQQHQDLLQSKLLEWKHDGSETVDSNNKVDGELGSTVTTNANDVAEGSSNKDHDGGNNNIDSSVDNKDDNNNIEIPSTEGPSADEVIEVHARAWNATAQTFGYVAPSTEEVAICLDYNPRDVITWFFGWMVDDADEELIQTVLTSHKATLQEESQSLRRKYNLGGQTQAAASSNEEEEINEDTSEENNEHISEEINEGISGEINEDINEKQKGHNDVNEVSNTVTGPTAEQKYRIMFDSWTAVAKKRGYDLPTQEMVVFAMSVGPEEAIVWFEWAPSRRGIGEAISSTDSDDNDLINEILGDFENEFQVRTSELYSEMGEPKNSSAEDNKDSSNDGRSISSDSMFEVIPGISKWINSLLDAEMQCGIVSYLEYDQVIKLVNMIGLSQTFKRDNIVSLSNDYRRESDQLLGCALRLERRPDHCVLFDTTASSCNAAHMVEMKSVGMIGINPRYDLLNADMTTGSFPELTAMNIRRLFGERITDQPESDMKFVDPAPPKKQRTKFDWGDDD